MKVPLVAAVLLLALGCVSPPPPSTQGKVWHLDEATGELVHVPSGFHFASEQQGCERVDPHEYDDSGENVSVGYNCYRQRFWLTLYVYPSSYGGTPEPEEHFRGVVGDALVRHGGSQVERAAGMQLPLGSRTLSGFTALLRWTEPERDVGSFVVLIPDGARFVKVRTTAELSGDDIPLKRAWDFTLDVLRSVAPAS